MSMRNSLTAFTLATALTATFAALGSPALAQNGKSSEPKQVAVIQTESGERQQVARNANASEPGEVRASHRASHRDRPPHIPGYGYRSTQ